MKPGIRNLKKTVKSQDHKINDEKNSMNRNTETQKSCKPASNSTRNNYDNLVNAIKEKFSGYILRKFDREIEHLVRLEENANNTPAETYHHEYYDYLPLLQIIVSMMYITVISSRVTVLFW